MGTDPNKTGYIRRAIEEAASTSKEAGTASRSNPRDSPPLEPVDISEEGISAIPELAITTTQTVDSTSVELTVADDVEKHETPKMTSSQLRAEKVRLGESLPVMYAGIHMITVMEDAPRGMKIEHLYPYKYQSEAISICLAVSAHLLIHDIVELCQIRSTTDIALIQALISIALCVGTLHTTRNLIRNSNPNPVIEAFSSMKRSSLTLQILILILILILGLLFYECHAKSVTLADAEQFSGYVRNTKDEALAKRFKDLKKHIRTHWQARGLKMPCNHNPNPNLNWQARGLKMPCRAFMGLFFLWYSIACWKIASEAWSPKTFLLCEFSDTTWWLQWMGWVSACTFFIFWGLFPRYKNHPDCVFEYDNAMIGFSFLMVMVWIWNWTSCWGATVALVIRGVGFFLALVGVMVPRSGACACVFFRLVT